jgi:hypothetical protein
VCSCVVLSTQTVHVWCGQVLISGVWRTRYVSCYHSEFLVFCDYISKGEDIIDVDQDYLPSAPEMLQQEVSRTTNITCLLLGTTALQQPWSPSVQTRVCVRYWAFASVSAILVLVNHFLHVPAITVWAFMHGVNYRRIFVDEILNYDVFVHYNFRNYFCYSWWFHIFNVTGF